MNMYIKNIFIQHKLNSYLTPNPLSTKVDSPLPRSEIYGAGYREGNTITVPSPCNGEGWVG